MQSKDLLQITGGILWFILSARKSSERKVTGAPAALVPPHSGCLRLHHRRCGVPTLARGCSCGGHGGDLPVVLLWMGGHIYSRCLSLTPSPSFFSAMLYFDHWTELICSKRNNYFGSIWPTSPQGRWEWTNVSNVMNWHQGAVFQGAICSLSISYL